MTKITKEAQFIADMIRCRGMEWVRLGMQVEVAGSMGTIVGMNSSANLDVVFANRLKYGKGPSNCHPWWETRYFDRDGTVIKDYRRQPTAISLDLTPAAVVA
ncbi:MULTISPECIES: hypothetical protein [unclassified Janthinobacterium]|uniref:hypothetical protein n=1 Tax=unclassified Janthinobacterium TaxID=2610881 RepID=UPI001611E209|nr:MULTISPECIES: hypothetical protein [unclassified Janthinobacterium]MBB5610592.1 hypothetical protein [Janthinobacterium sp. S3T4]MBB5615954.1 hypothetical protein [Janthinobacterium sp. S3M3]